MVQKELKRPRGRPRAYDPDAALTQARDTFWQLGYAGTSMDVLSEAMDMNRPSLYAAFGDKRALYLAAMDRYIDASRNAMEEVLAADMPLPRALIKVYDLALNLYFPPHAGARGCFLIGTSVVEAATDGQIREKLQEGLQSFDKAFETRFKRARTGGELPAAAKPALLAKLASAVLYMLALRSRTGDTRASLRVFATASVEMLCSNAGYQGVRKA